MDVVAALVADAQASEIVEPGMGSLDDPAVAPEFLAALDATASDVTPWTSSTVK